MSVLETGMSAFMNVGSAINAGLQGANSSLIEFTKPTQVEPIVVVDNSVVYNDVLPDVMQSLLSQFAGYYLQAAALLTNIDRVTVLRQLERLNPDRKGDALGRIWSNESISIEDYKTRLPRYNPIASLEAFAPPAVVNTASTNTKLDSDEYRVTGIGKDSITQLRNLENLSVGKMIMVTVTAPDKVSIEKTTKGTGTNAKTTEKTSRSPGVSVDIPVNIRLQAAQLDSHQIVHMLSQGNQDLSSGERKDGFLSGRLKFWKDIVFCMDLISSHRRALMKDKDGVMTEIAKRARNNTVASAVTNQPSLATASNMVIMSDSTAAQLENNIKGRLRDYRVRQKIFDVTSLMILVVIDPNLNRIKFYYRGIELGSEFSPRDLKGSNKGNGPDILDIMKAYQMSAVPSL
jgi:hypothetical protein